MSWTLRFWNSHPTPADPAVTWYYGADLDPPGTLPEDVPPQQVTDVTGYLNSIASLSPIIAQGLLDNFGHDIRFGYRAGDTGNAVLGPIDEYVLIDLDAAKNVYWFNTEGMLVRGDLRLILMHELTHIYLNQTDPNGSHTPSDAVMNSANFDFRGPAVDEQNLIAIDANLTGQIRTSYFASLSSDLQPEIFARFNTGVSYSNSNPIDITRWGTEGVDNINHTLNTAYVNDLLFGFGGDDTISAGSGNDYVYGGDGNDTIYGGTGNDFLFGEAGDNNLFGDDGNDVLVGTEGANTLDGGAGNDTIWARGSGSISLWRRRR